MPVDPETFHTRVVAAAGADGRPPLPDMADWETSPFDPAGLRTVPLRAPELPEPPRNGEGGQPCGACERGGQGAVWSDDHWILRVPAEPSGVPLVLLLEPRAHHDIADLPDDLAAEMGRLQSHVARAMEGLPHIGRTHVLRIGDGGAHLHLWFVARPEGFGQLLGSFLIVWDDLLPAVPVGERDADAHTVAEALVASYGGTASAAG